MNGSNGMGPMKAQNPSPNGSLTASKDYYYLFISVLWILKSGVSKYRCCVKDKTLRQKWKTLRIRRKRADYPLSFSLLSNRRPYLDSCEASKSWLLTLYRRDTSSTPPTKMSFGFTSDPRPPDSPCRILILSLNSISTDRKSLLRYGTCLEVRPLMRPRISSSSPNWSRWVAPVSIGASGSAGLGVTSRLRPYLLVEREFR